MNVTEYGKNVLVTESKDFEPIKSRIDDRMIRLLHASLGLSSELAELVDAINSLEEIDYVNVSEEIGDASWYCSIAISALGLDPEEISIHEVEAKDSGLKVKGVYDLDTALAAVVWASGMFSDM